MSDPVKPIPANVQRRAGKLPCDGVGRYKVGKRKNLSYSQAYDAILEEITLNKDAQGHRTIKHGGALRLVNLNKTYFSVASEFIQKAIDDKKAANAAAVASGESPDASPEVTIPDETVDVTSHDSPPTTLNTATGETSTVLVIEPGEEVTVFQPLSTAPFATIKRSPNGATYTVRIKSDEPIRRTRSLDKVKELLTAHCATWETRS